MEEQHKPELQTQNWDSKTQERIKNEKKILQIKNIVEETKEQMKNVLKLEG